MVWWSIDDSGYLTRKERQASEVDCQSGMEEGETELAEGKCYMWASSLHLSKEQL